MNQLALVKQACRLFPRTDYLDKNAVDHARRGYLKAVAWLRKDQPSKWVKDQHVPRLQ